MVIHKRSSQFRSFDAFSKPIEAARNRTTTGGIITILASATSALLFISQMFIYFQVDTRHSFIMSQSHPLSHVIPTDAYSRFLHSNKHKKGKSSDFVHTFDSLEKNRMTVSVHITFPHVKCEDFDISHDGASDSNGKLAKLYGRNVFSKRTPSEYDWAMANGLRTDGLSKQKKSKDRVASNGCTIYGKIVVPRIGGDFTFTISSEAWQSVLKRIRGALGTMTTNSNKWGSLTNAYNLTYFIHDISFGEQFTVSQNPLNQMSDVIDEGLGLAHTNIMVTLIPTRYKRFARRTEDLLQTSVSKHVIGPENMARSSTPILPGLSIQYDFSPLAVHHHETRDNIFVFLSSVMGIVGGVFVTVGLVSGCLIQSAAAVAKKID